MPDADIWGEIPPGRPVAKAGHIGECAEGAAGFPVAPSFFGRSRAVVDAFMRVLREAGPTKGSAILNIRLHSPPDHRNQTAHTPSRARVAELVDALD